MGQGMEQQRGAALVIVLALLTGALVVGISGMQRSLIDERLAGNYRASAQAQMNAEEAATQALQKRAEYDAQAGKDNLDELGRDAMGSSEDIKSLRYETVSKNNLKNKKKACSGLAESECFYFPLTIDDKNYWAAFGAVMNPEGKVLSQHVVLLTLIGSGSFPGEDLEENFNNYGILGRDDVDVEKDFSFWGKARARKKIDAKDIVCGEEGVTNCLESNKGVTVPSFDFKGFMESMKKRFPVEKADKNNGCDIESSRTLNSETQHCVNQVDVSGSASITDSTVYFADAVDFDGDLVVRNSTLFFADDVDFNGSLEVHNSRLIAQGQVDINGAVSGSEITLVSHDQLDVFGSVHASDSVLYAGEEMDIFGSLSLTDTSIVVKDQLDTEGGLALTNVAIVVDDEINITSKYGPVLNNVLVMAKDQLDVDLERDARVERGWFYSDDQLDMDIKRSPNMRFCGSLVARDEIDFITDDRSIIEFNSAGRGGCSEFEPFEDPRGSGAGKWQFEAWE